MVGLFHLGSKGSPSRATRSTDTARPVTPPPPPYIQNGDGPTYFATETTTTTTHVVTTTQTTTHFFSLPLWRRRAQQPTHPAPMSPASRASSADELGIVYESSFKSTSRLDKDLPPTPPTEAEAGPSTRTGSHISLTETRETRSADRSPSRHSTQRNRSGATTPASSSPLSGCAVPEPASQGTAALARAALGLGLPPLMFSGMPELELSDNSTAISFATTTTRPERVASASLSSSVSMRRAKSFQRGPDEEQVQSYAALREQRRTRGLSLGPLLASTIDEGAKDGTVERKSLSRKSSFWSRKRNDSRTPVPIIAPPTDRFLAQPSLPSLQPISPFNMETSISESGLRDEQVELYPGAELRRRHSERLPSSRPSRPSVEHGTSDPPNLPQGRRRRRPSGRPQTADSTHGPRAVSSFFPSPAEVATEPVQFDSPTDDLSPRTSYPASRRPRSSTNPPLLHRLSINLFGSSPSQSPTTNSTALDSYSRSPSTSFSSASRPSLSKSSPKVSTEIPRPRLEEETPEAYLKRLVEAVSKAEIAGVLAAT
jgi:hypothetical protein